MIASPVMHPYLVEDRVVFPLSQVPERMEEALTISGRKSHAPFIGEVAHLSAHLRNKDMQEQVLSLEEPFQSLAWHIEDARVMRAHLERRATDTLLLKSRFQTFLSDFSRISAPTQFDFLVMWAAVTSRFYMGIISGEEQEAIRDKIKTQLSPQMLDDVESLVHDIMEMEAGDGEFGRHVLQIARLVSTWELNTSLRKRCVLVPMENIEMSGNGQGEAEDTDDEAESEPAEGDSSDDPQESDEGVEGDPDPASTPETPETPSEDTEDKDQEDSTEESSQEQEQGKQEKADHEQTPTTEDEDDLGDTLDMPDEDAQPPEIPEYRAEQRKEKEEAAKMDNTALREMGKAGLDKRGVKFSSRPPTQADIQLASKLARTLKNARWRAPRKVVQFSAIPPGKLVPRAAVFSAAQRSMGIPVTAKPFRQTLKKREEGPPIVLGLMCDVSGSMSASAEPMAQFAWACSRAVPKAGGEFAAVTFGKKVKTLVPLNSKLNAVPRFTTTDGYEAGHSAMLSLAGGLGFFRRKEGVKILLISSDAFWQAKEVQSSLAVLSALQKMGVLIIWLPFDYNSNGAGANDWFTPPLMKYGTVVRFSKMDEAPKQLGKLLEEEARKA